MYGDGPLPALMMAQEANGIAKDKLFPINLDQAFAKLAQVKPAVKVWYTSGDQLKQAFRTGEVTIGIAYNGRAASLIKEGLHLAISWDGAVYEPVYLCVVKDAPHLATAFKYLDWIATHPDGQATYVKLSGYGVPNPTAFDAVPQEQAQYVPDYPPNFRQMAIEDVGWYQDNKSKVDSRWRNLVSG
jgi:spermidine/putrescine-binding protein